MNAICVEPRSTTSPVRVAEHAGRAVLTELLLTPKPGLVDRRNCGAHDDMDLQTFLASARAIAPWWQRFVEKGHASAHMPASALLPLVRPTGVLCEQAMFEATRGVNTHKGAIFSLGLLCFAAGRLVAQGIAPSRERMCAQVADMCAGLVERELDRGEEPRTAGERVFRQPRAGWRPGRSGLGLCVGASRNAAGLRPPAGARACGDEVALLEVLLHLMAFNADTNLVSRGGLAGLQYVRECARGLLREGGALAPDGLKKMEAFDDDLIARHLSPGGSADLLGVTWFLAQFPTEMEAR